MIAILFLLTLSTLADGPSDREERLIDLLRSRGILSEEEARSILDANPAEGAESSGAAASPSVEVSPGRGVVLRDANDRYEFRLRGRLAVDVVLHREGENSLGDGTELRQARLELNGRWGERDRPQWRYKVQVDFSDDEVSLKSNELAYLFDPRRNHRRELVVGQFREPFGLEALTSTTATSFLERALPRALAPDRSIGIGFRASKGPFAGSLGVFGEGQADDVDGEGDEGHAVTARGIVTPIQGHTRLIHFGLSGSYRITGDDDEVRLRSRPESHLTDLFLVDTGILDESRAIIRGGVEAAWVHGPVSLQAEAIALEVTRRRGRSDPTLWGASVFGSWIVTGESRPYRYPDGTFGAIEPIGRYGAVELLARASILDLNDDDVRGGESRQVTFGLNWMINSQIRVMTNLIFVDHDRDANANGTAIGRDTYEIFQTRVQLRF